MSGRASEASETKLCERLVDILLAAPLLMDVLLTARDLRLPDWLVFSGAVYQPVLNHLTGRPHRSRVRFLYSRSWWHGSIPVSR
jgi:hypothetical protein